MFVIIARIIKNLEIKQSIKPLIGRWTVDYNINRINRKVDLSNEDHCGTCVSEKPSTNNVSPTFETIKPPSNLNRSFKYKPAKWY